MRKIVMPYTVGEDPETGEFIVADIRTRTFFLRGPASEQARIFELVRAANEGFAILQEETSSEE